MTAPDPSLSLQPLERERERVITLLSRHFANDGLSLDELEARLEMAYHASSVAEVRALAADLPALEGNLAPTVAPSSRSPYARIRSVLGAIHRRGVWALPQHLDLVGLFSDTVLDLREAQLAPGTTEIHVRAVCASVRIIVPPHVQVVSEASALLASVSDRSRSEPASGGPILLITGKVLMSDLSIRTRTTLD